MNRRERGGARRTDHGGVARDAVVLPAGGVGDELDPVVDRAVRVLAAERLEAPVRLHGRQRGIVRVERGVRRATKVLRDAVSENEREDPVVDRVRCVSLDENVR